MHATEFSYLIARISCATFYAASQNNNSHALSPTDAGREHDAAYNTILEHS
jgi:hypothetical protein